MTLHFGLKATETDGDSVREWDMARKQTKSDTASDKLSAVSPALMEDIRQIIGEARRSVATTVNAGLTLLYWRIGKRIVNEVLGKERARYGQQIAVVWYNTRPPCALSAPI